MCVPPPSQDQFPAAAPDLETLLRTSAGGDPRRLAALLRLNPLQHFVVLNAGEACDQQQQQQPRENHPAGDCGGSSGGSSATGSGDVCDVGGGDSNDRSNGGFVVVCHDGFGVGEAQPKVRACLHVPGGMRQLRGWLQELAYRGSSTLPEHQNPSQNSNAGVVKKNPSPTELLEQILATPAGKDLVSLLIYTGCLVLDG